MIIEEKEVRKNKGTYDYKSGNQKEKFLNKDFSPDGFTCKNLAIQFKLKYPNNPLGYKEIILVLNTLGKLIMRDCLKGIWVVLPSQLGTIQVTLKESKFFLNKTTGKYQRRINGGATRAKRKELESNGDFTTDPTVYFNSDYILSWKLRIFKTVSTDKIVYAPLKEMYMYKYNFPIVFKKALSNMFKTHKKEELVDIFGVYVTN